jgi:hypothetical protein
MAEGAGLAAGLDRISLFSMLIWASAADVEALDPVDDAWVMLLVAWPAAPTPTSTAHDAARTATRRPTVVFLAGWGLARCFALVCRHGFAMDLDMIDRLSHLRS